MYDRIIKSGIETNTYLHSNSSHKGVVCVKVCVGFSARLFLHLEIYRIGERRFNNINGNYFLLPNTIFDEELTPMEFVVYSFFISRKDKRGQSYYSIPLIAEYCGICENSCRKVIKDLVNKGLVDVSERYMGNAQQSNIYTVHKI